MSMKTKEQEYIIAIKMLIESADKVFSRDVGSWSELEESEQVESELQTAIEYGKSILNAVDEQTEYELNVDEISTDETSDSNDDIVEHSHTSIVPEPEPEPKVETKSDSVVKDEKFQNDLPFDIPVIAELNEDLKQDVEQGLLDEQTADRVVELASMKSDYYRFASGVMYILKPEDINIEQSASTFFANFLSKEYGQNLNEINVLDMKLDYKNHVFRSLTWTSKYGVKFNLSLQKYIDFLEKYVL